MGTDVSGFIECRTGPDEDWTAAVDIGLCYLGRNYDEFATLFDIRNTEGYEPVAAGRGLPEDVSAAVAKNAIDGHGTTWIGWDEIRSIDWATSPFEPVHHRDPSDPAALPAAPRFLTGGEIAAASGVTVVPFWLRDDPPTPRRLDLLSNILRTFDIMAVLAGLHGAANVRLVVWFD